MRAICLLTLLAFAGLEASITAQTNDPTNPITRELVRNAEVLAGLEFSDEKIDMMLSGLQEQLQYFQDIHKFRLSNSVPPALMFNPIPQGMKFEKHRKPFKMSATGKVKLPEKRDDLAFYSVGQLAALIKNRQLSSEDLTRFCIERLKRYGPKLECVVTLMEDSAIKEAKMADAEIAAGHYRGPLHGIPYGAKDLLSARGAPTTWGAVPYTNQVFDFDATVIQKLRKAGAILVVKTTLGELAMGDVWFGGLTRNPWNLKQGSSGSSAGTASATAAGLIPFGIGSETLGSIVSPSDRCGDTGLRPTYGRVSRAGAMTLSWSMDKLGPICRTVEDCAIVFNAIYGPDPLDQTLYDVPFNYDPKVNLKMLRVGCLRSDFDKEKGERRNFDEATLKQLCTLGAQLTPIELPDYPLSSISFVLSTEGAAAFEDLTRTGQDDLLKQQSSGSWPNTFRKKRFIPAVEFLQAQRIRYLAIQDTAKVFEKVDLIIAPSFTGKALLLSNLTGHPCVVIPNGFTTNGAPSSICFIGRLFDEATILAVAKSYQDSTDFHRKHPILN